MKISQFLASNNTTPHTEKDLDLHTLKPTLCLCLVQEKKKRERLSHPGFEKALSGSQALPQSWFTKPTTPSQWVMEGTNLACVT